MSKTLPALWLALAVVSTSAAPAAPAPQSKATGGVKVNLTFVNLDPGETYSIAVTDLSQFEFTEWKSEGVPADLEVSRALVSFKGPARTSATSKYSSASFAVGAFMWARDLPWELRLEEPAVLFVDSPELGIFELITGSPSKAATRAKVATTNEPSSDCYVEPPDGCTAIRCTLDSRCPLRPEKPLKCYGPLLDNYWCCWEDPFP